MNAALKQLENAKQWTLDEIERLKESKKRLEENLKNVESEILEKEEIVKEIDSALEVLGNGQN